MRVEGRLTKWNDDRGFGFASSSRDDTEVFVHISAFPRDGMRPRVGERLSFDVAVGSDGRRRAIDLVCLDRQVAYSPPASSRRAASRRPRRGGLARILPVAVVLALGSYGYAEYSGRSPASLDVGEQAEQIGQVEQAEQLPPARSYQCDGRTMCSQMSSCEEATFFLRNCPNVKMDGDYDGIPCEQQLCGG